MKKCKLMIAALLTISSLNGFATDKEKTTATATKSTTVLNIERASDKSVYRLVYQSKVEGLVRVSIYSEQGHLLLRDKIQNTTGFCRPYNFNALPIGNYTVTIEDAAGKITKSIAYGEEATIEASNASTVNVSVQEVTASAKYELKVVGSTQSPLQVKIYDAAYNVVFSEEITEKANFKKVYDLSKTGLTSLTFEVRNASGILTSTTF